MPGRRSGGAQGAIAAQHVEKALGLDGFRDVVLNAEPRRPEPPPAHPTTPFPTGYARKWTRDPREALRDALFPARRGSGMLHATASCKRRTEQSPTGLG